VPFNQQQAQTIAQWAQKHHINANQPCPACTSTQWAFVDIISVGLSQQPGVLDMGQAGPRMLRRLCSTCGFVMMFDADAVGV
jgi:hypothetical protein